jgi:hypothetical protein
MTCTTCGAELPAGAAFCPNCGTRTPQPASAGVPTTVMSPEVEQQRATPPLFMPPAERAPEPTYAPQGYYPAAQPATSNTAIVSLVFGILTWTVFPLIGAVIAVIAGHMARNEIRSAGGRLSGDGLAVAGMIMGYVQIILSILGACLFALFFIFIAGVASTGS